MAMPPKDPFDDFDDMFDSMDNVFDGLDSVFDNLSSGSMSDLKARLEKLKTKVKKPPTIPNFRRSEFINDTIRTRNEFINLRVKRGIRNIVVFGSIVSLILLALTINILSSNKDEKSTTPLVEKSAPLNPSLDDKQTTDIPTLKIK